MQNYYDDYGETDLPNLDDLDEQQLIDLLNQRGLSEEELNDLVTEMQAQGMKGTIVAVKNPQGPEAQAAKEYMEYHQKLPPDPTQLSSKKLQRSEKILLSERSTLEEKKIALVILAHAGKLQAWQALEKYAKNPDQKLKTWLEIAKQECEMFLKSDLLDKPLIGLNKLSSMGHNDLCPCGSGKKYKKCCLGKNIS